MTRKIDRLSSSFCSLAIVASLCISLAAAGCRQPARSRATAPTPGITPAMISESVGTPATHPTIAAPRAAPREVRGPKVHTRTTQRPIAEPPVGTGATQLAPSTDPKEVLEGDRLTGATRGLSFESDMVVVPAKAPGGRAKALEAVRLGEASLTVQNNWSEAAGHFRDAILADPAYAPAYDGLGRSLMANRDTRRAEAAFRSALTLDPSLMRSRFELGRAAQMRGDFGGAVVIWQDLVLQDPDYPDGFARMAIASYCAQDMPSAWRFLEEADKRHQNVPPQFRQILQQVAPKP